MSSSAAAILSGDDNDKHHSPAHADPSVEDCRCEDEPEEDPEEEEEEEEEEGEEEEEEEEEEVEEEEEEVEEEEEEEEESEDGKDDEEEEIGDGPSCSPHATDNIQQDVIPSVEFERHEKRLRSCSTQEKAEVGLPSDTFAIAESTGNIKSSSSSSEQLETPNGASCTSDKVSKLPKLKENLKIFEDNGIQEFCVGEKDAGSFPEKKTPRSHDEVHCDSNSHPLNSEIRHDETTKPSCCVGEVATLINKESNDVFHFEGGIDQSGLHSEDIKQRASSLDAPQIRPRSLSPCTEFVDGTKQSPVICDFFSKGWCIKGNSCKFLHTKDHVDNAGQQPERNVAAAKFKSELQIDEGLTDSTEKSRLSALRDPVASSAKIAGRDSLRQDPYPNNHSTSPIVERSFNAIGNNLLPEYGSFPSHSVITRGTKRSSWTPSSYAATMDEPSSKRSQSPFNDHTSPALSRYQSSGSNYSLPAIGIFPPDRVSAWTRSSMSYGSSSLNADSLNAQKVLNRNGELYGSRSASLLRSSSPFSASEPQIAHPSSGEHKRNFFSYDWEPSKPFRPSFFLSLPGMSSPGSQYDPIRDSIEQSNPVDGSFKVYPFGDPNLNGTLLPKYNANKYLITSLDKFQDNVLDKDCYAHDRNLSISEAEAAGSSVHDQQNETVVAKGENPLSSPHGMDVSETNKIKTGFDLRHQSDGSRHRKELKIDRNRHTDEMVVDQKTDAVLNQDSKAFRHFRAALVESVKESLKPAWREGRVSKDAHNLIVKKAVDKVLSTIQSHQIPSSVELIKQYLSSSQPKIVKLVEGYVDKYGKS